MAKKPNKHSNTFSQGWHPDGRPFTAQDYRDAGLPVPTLRQLALWAKADAQRAAERAAERRARRESSIRTRNETEITRIGDNCFCKSPLRSVRAAD